MLHSPNLFFIQYIHREVFKRKIAVKQVALSDVITRDLPGERMTSLLRSIASSPAAAGFGVSKDGFPVK